MFAGVAGDIYEDYGGTKRGVDKLSLSYSLVSTTIPENEQERYF